MNKEQLEVDMSKNAARHESSADLFKRRDEVLTQAGRPRNRRSRLVAIAAMAVTGGLLAAASSLGQGRYSIVAEIRCAPRVIILDASSSDRSPKLSQLAYELISSAADSAVVCETPLMAVAVSGGGTETSIVTTDDLSKLTPIGPTLQIRRLRFGAEQQAALELLVQHRLRAAYLATEPKDTSVAALFNVASQQITPGTQVVLVTDGVNNDAQVNLNRPLGAGQGNSLAGSIHVAPIRDSSVTFVGIAQVDSSTPPPSPTWADEVQAFNLTLCHDSHAARCRLFDTASVAQALNS